MIMPPSMRRHVGMDRVLVLNEAKVRVVESKVEGAPTTVDANSSSLAAASDSTLVGGGAWKRVPKLKMPTKKPGGSGVAVRIIVWEMK